MKHRMSSEFIYQLFALLIAVISIPRIFERLRAWRAGR